MEIARTLNDQYLFAEPMNISEMIEGEVEAEPQVRELFPDASIPAEIKRARQFRENFQRRRIEEKD